MAILYKLKKTTFFKPRLFAKPRGKLNLIGMYMLVKFLSWIHYLNDIYCSGFLNTKFQKNLLYFLVKNLHLNYYSIVVNL